MLNKYSERGKQELSVKIHHKERTIGRNVNHVFSKLLNFCLTTGSTRSLYERKLEETMANDRTFYREEGNHILPSGLLIYGKCKIRVSFGHIFINFCGFFFMDPYLILCFFFHKKIKSKSIQATFYPLIVQIPNLLN